MSGFREQFRDGLSDKWPEALDDMIKFLSSTERERGLEIALGRHLAELSDDADLGKPLCDELVLDAIAFELLAGGGSPWGNVYFGPWVTGPTEDGKGFERPGRSRITSAAIQQWRGRWKVVASPVAKARFADAAWELAQMAGCDRDPADARAAIDAYCDTKSWPSGQRALADRMRRALSLARSLSDGTLVERVSNLLVQAVKDHQGRRDGSSCLILAGEELLPEPGVSIEIKDYLCEQLDSELHRSAALGDGHRVSRFADILISQFRSQDDIVSEQKVALVVSGCFEFMATSAAPLVASGHLKQAFKYCRDARLREKADELRLAIESADRRTVDELAEFTHEFKIDTKDIIEYADAVTKGDLAESFRRFFFHILPRKDETDKSLNELAKNSFLLQAMPREVITAAGTTVRVGPVGEDRESHVIMHMADKMHYGAIFVSAAADRLVERHSLDAGDLASFGEISGLLPRQRHEIRRRAFVAYLSGDYVAFVHLIVPQIEHALRLLLRDLGKSTNTTRDDKTWRQLTLGSVLKQPALSEALGQDGAYYLRVLLTEDLGLNVRDLVCHGLVGDGWFTKSIADRLLHVVVGLALFELLPPPGGGQVSGKVDN